MGFLNKENTKTKSQRPERVKSLKGIYKSFPKVGTYSAGGKPAEIK